MISKLKPCPFCISTTMIVYTNPNDGQSYISCTKCQASTGLYPDYIMAINAWNTRNGLLEPEWKCNG